MTHVVSVDILPRASTPRPGRLLFVSLFVMLNLPLIFTLTTGIDQYSLFASDSVGHRPYPLLLSFCASTVLAVLSSIVHHFLWKQQYLGIGGLPGPFKRAALVIGVPIFLAFLPSSLLTVNGGQAYPVAVALLMFGGLIIATALKDPETGRLNTSESLVWLGLATLIILVFAAFSIGVMVLFYTQDILPPVGNLFGDLKIDYAKLGYDPAEFAQRHRATLPMFTIAAMSYMMIVFGGIMLGSIWKAGLRPGNALETPADPDGTAPAPVGGVLNLWEPESQGTIPEEAEADGVTATAGVSEPTVESLLSQIRSLLEPKGKIPIPDGPYVIVINGVNNRISEDHKELLRKDEVIDSFGNTFDIYVNFQQKQAWLDHKKTTFIDDTYLFCTLAAYATERPGYVWENSKLEDQMMAYFPSTTGPTSISAVIGRLIDLGERTIIERVRPPGRSRILPMMKVCLISEWSMYKTGRK